MARASASKGEEREITRGRGNVFADLGFPDAEERQTKLRLALPHRQMGESVEFEHRL